MVNSISGKNQYDYAQAKEKGLIEKGIYPLTEALYQIGANPLASCEGHAWKKSRHGFIDRLIYKNAMGSESQEPYVLFSSTIEMARWISEAIQETTKEERTVFNLYGVFHSESSDLLWVIRTADRRIEKQIMNFEQFCKDIEHLSKKILELKIIQEAMTTEFTHSRQTSL